MIRQLVIEGGAYEFVLPTSFMPQYKQHEIVSNYCVPDEWYLETASVVLQDVVPEYSFSYSFEIKSKDKITFIGAPADAIKIPTQDGHRIQMETSYKIPKREIKIHYKTDNMLKPSLKYQTDEKTGEVACFASFVPTFEPPQP
jgi:hypothetical protein